jgi:hypothetical protein
MQRPRKKDVDMTSRMLGVRRRYTKPTKRSQQERVQRMREIVERTRERAGRRKKRIGRMTKRAERRRE